MTKPVVHFSVVAVACSVMLLGCEQQAESPLSVRPSRLVNTDAQRIVSYQAFYEDGVVTYLDYEPFGSVDLISSERGDEFRIMVREGFDPGVMPVNGPEPVPIDAQALAAFGVLSRGVDVSSIPWSSSAHGTLEIPMSVGSE